MGVFLGDGQISKKMGVLEIFDIFFFGGGGER